MRRELAAILVSAAMGEASAAACDALAGTYSLAGKIDEGARGITLSQIQQRPDRLGATQFRIVVESDALRVQLADANSSAIGEDIVLRGQCGERAWITSSKFDGTGDGTRVSGARTWTYSREGADLVVRYAFSETARHFFGLFPSKNEGVITARFARSEK